MQITTITEAAEATVERIKSSSSSLSALIVLIVLLVLCAAAYIAYRFLMKKNDNSEAAAAKTAQEFINVFDIDENCLYTIDGMCFVYLRIDGMSLEMFERGELSNISKNFARSLVSVNFPWKFISVSRPMDIRETLQSYTDLQNSSTPGHKALLQQEINELITMTNRGETLERQHYAVIWGRDDKEHNLPLKKCADELAKIFLENKIHCEVLGKENIISLLNAVNIPAYNHLETKYDFSDELIRAIIR